MSYRIAALVTCLFVTVPFGHAQDIRVDQDPEANAATISIDAPQGILEWRSVAIGIARAQNLNEDDISSFLSILIATF